MTPRSGDHRRPSPHNGAAPLDAALKARVRAVLDGRPVTEAELRRLFEEGRACALIVGGQLAKGERRLAELASDPESSLTELAAAVRRVNELRPDLDELHAMLADLEQRAHALRASWFAGR